MDLELQDHVALVAAASRGLGAAVARRFAQEGARVVICGRDEARLSDAVERIKAETGADALGIQADVTLPADVNMLVADVMETFGRIDHLVVNAGGPPAGGFDSFQPEDWEKATSLTLMSAVRLCYAVVPHMKRLAAQTEEKTRFLEQPQPSIVFVTSVSVKQPIANLILSNSIRMALVGLMKSLSQELGPLGIRVNAVAPGWTRTERVTELLEARAKANGTTPDEEAAKIVGDLPLGRIAQPEELAKATVFLASPAASYITGVVLPVDGGAIKASL